MYTLVNHQEAAKDTWDKVKMLMKGTELSYPERECILYNLFDKFAHVSGETLYEYYWIFSHLINDMHTIRMTMQQVQVNTKFLNALPSEWSKFVTDVKLAKSLYTTNYDKLYAYLSQHERNANEVRINRYSMYPPPQQFTLIYAAPIYHQHHHTPVNPQQHPVSPPPLISPSMTQQSQAEFPQLDSSLAVPMFQQREDPIECINKAMAFLNQETIQDGRVTVQQVQGRQHQSYAGIGNRGNATILKGNVTVGPPRVVTCYNYQGEGHMARQYDLDVYDSDCDDLSSAKAVLMANISSCDPDILSKVLYSDSYLNDMINQDVQEMQYYEQTHVDDFEEMRYTVVVISFRTLNICKSHKMQLFRI
ncbi:hypothetical protein Tco_1282488 [Tanacetum coccineum]